MYVTYNKNIEYFVKRQGGHAFGLIPRSLSSVILVTCRIDTRVERHRTTKVKIDERSEGTEAIKKVAVLAAVAAQRVVSNLPPMYVNGSMWGPGTGDRRPY